MSMLPTLRQTDVFVDFTPTQLALIESICIEESYDAGDVIFEENSDGNELYVIVEGEVDIQVDPSLIGKRKKRKPQTIATLRRGQNFGEVALVDQGLRSARAVAAEDDTRVLVIPHAKLMLMCDSYPQMGYRLMRNLAADMAMKIRQTNLTLRDYLSQLPNLESDE